MKHLILNYKIITILVIITTSMLYIIFSLNYNHSNCNDFPIYIRPAFFYGNFAVNTSISKRSTIFTQKNNKSINIGEINMENNSVSLGNQAILRTDYDDKDMFNLSKKEVISDYLKLEACIKNNEKYTFEELPSGWQ